MKTDPSEIQKLKNLASSISKVLEDQEKIAIPYFSVKLDKAASLYPGDSTINMFSQVIGKMSDSNKLFISRAEVKDIYKRLYSHNTKFASLFADELGTIEKKAEPQKYDRPASEGFDELAGIDQNLLNELKGSFGDAVKTYTDQMATQAMEACHSELSYVNALHTVKVSEGNDKCLICLATFETPKGKTSFYIPVSVIANKVCLPGILVGNSGPQVLNASSIKQYITKNAGDALLLNPTEVLNLSINLPSEVDAVDLAITKLNFNKKKAEKIDYNKVIETVEVPKAREDEVNNFTQMFDTAAGRAGFQFGAEKVKSANKIVKNKLTALGFKSQIAVNDCGSDQIVYAVSISDGLASFKVPVRIQANKILEPMVILSSEGLENFSAIGINSILKKSCTDYKLVAVASPLYDLKPSELVKIVQEAVNESNYVKAEDALNILSQTEDDKAYRVAFDVYTDGLSGKTATKTTQCKRVLKNANSIHAICGHLNLPLEKVYQDKYGNCCPAYRKDMAESSDGTMFMDCKVLV